MNASPHFLPACLALNALERVSSTRDDDARLIRPATAPDCGPAALATLLRFYLDVSTTEAEIAGFAGAKPGITTSMRGLEAAARAKGCGAGSLRLNYETLENQAHAFPLPIIVRWDWPQTHFVLVFSLGEEVAVADPCVGHFWLSRRAFLQRWLEAGTEEGLAFLAARADGFVDEASLDATLGELERAHRALQVAKCELI